MRDPLIDPKRVKEMIFSESLAENLSPDSENYLLVDGIVHPAAFDIHELEKHRVEVRNMLHNLPKEFQPPSLGGGGGWSFLNACDDRNGNQWTGLHWTMEMLFQLGIGLNLATWLMPREFWAMMPGGMPYVGVKE